MVSWQFLVLGTLGAIGAALAVGTLAALVRYHRTGAFPGAAGAEPVTRGRLLNLWLRVVIGAALAAAGLVAMADAGLL